MLLVSLLRNALLILTPVSIIITTYLYLYPLFNGCAFPIPLSTSNDSPFLHTIRQHTSNAFDATAIAPFRLLALGDPQLEGDTSIPDPAAFTFPHFFKTFHELFDQSNSLLHRVRFSLHALIDFYLDDIPKTLEGYRKKLDLVGNDHYLAHIYRTLYWWTKPTHVSVLGDLVGSQWIEDAEFEIRAARYWNRVFKHGTRVEDKFTGPPIDGEGFKSYPLEEDAEGWKRRVINIAGNHDIGYAGDLTPERFERFERVFGRANYELRFHLNNITSLPGSDDSLNITVPADQERAIPELRIIVLNDMNIDTPALSATLQSDTYNFINSVIMNSPPVERTGLFTLMLTHIPLHKAEGVCIDAPFFAFHDSEDFAYGIREQNHLSLDASIGLLEGVFGMSGDSAVDGNGVGRHGMIITGHDHEGCDSYHFINQNPPLSVAESASPSQTNESIEIPGGIDFSHCEADAYSDACKGKLPPSESTEAAEVNLERDHNSVPGTVDSDETATLPTSSPDPSPSEDPNSPSWDTVRTSDANRLQLPQQRTSGIPGIREVTLRSMMGEFGGHAGLVSLWFDENEWEWKYGVAECKLGKQHWWWAVHIVDLIVVIGFVLHGVSSILYELGIKIDVPIQAWYERAVESIMTRVKRIIAAKPVLIKKEGNGSPVTPPSAGRRSVRRKRSQRSLSGNATGSASEDGTGSVNGSVNGSLNGSINGSARKNTRSRRPLSSVFEQP